jgi:hypothetical protein
VAANASERTELSLGSARGDRMADAAAVAYLPPWNREGRMEVGSGSGRGGGGYIPPRGWPTPGPREQGRQERSSVAFCRREKRREDSRRQRNAPGTSEPSFRRHRRGWHFRPGEGGWSLRREAVRRPPCRIGPRASRESGEGGRSPERSTGLNPEPAPRSGLAARRRIYPWPNGSPT